MLSAASDPMAATRLIQEALRVSVRPDTYTPPSHARSSRTSERSGREAIPVGADQSDGQASAKRSRHCAPSNCRWTTTLIDRTSRCRKARTLQNAASPCASGQRDFRLFIPSAKPRGLIVMLHGCRQTAEDFAVGTNMNAIAEEHDLLVAYPHQPSSANAMSCWNWFRPQDQARLGGEGRDHRGAHRKICAPNSSIPQENIFLAGLSAGGAMAAVLGSTYPALYAAVGIHSGLAYKSAHDVNSAFAAMRGQNQTAHRDGGTRVPAEVDRFSWRGEIKRSPPQMPPDYGKTRCDRKVQGMCLK